MTPDWIKQRLNERKLTQVELAHRIGLSESAMSKLMNGVRMIKAFEADRIREVLGEERTENVSPLERRLLDAVRMLENEERSVAAAMIEALAGQRSAD